MAQKNNKRICPEYVGVACIDGTCPKANKDEYEERCIPIVNNCRECHRYKGCEDCVFQGNSEYCDKARK